MTKPTYLKNLGQICQYTYWPIVIFQISSLFLKYIKCYVGLFESCCKIKTFVGIIKLDRRKSPNIPKFPLIILEVFDSWGPLFMSRFWTSLNISSSFLWKRQGEILWLFAYFSYSVYARVTPIFYYNFYNMITFSA